MENDREGLAGMALKDEFSLPNVYAYVQACVDVAHYLSTLNAEGRKSIVLPSRGAFPIYKTADHVREYLKYVIHDYLILPFTADESQGLSTALARRHWVKVLAAESAGVMNDNWKFVRRAEAKLFGHEERQTPFGIGPFVMIDTAISGRAATEILDALDEEQLDYHLILVADEMGTRLKPEYERRISANDRVTLMRVPALYTEDRGCAMMGMTTALFPDMGSDECIMSLPLHLRYQPLFVNAGAVNPNMASASEFYSYLNAMHFVASKICLGVPWGDDDEIVVEEIWSSLSRNLFLVGTEATLDACAELTKWGRIEATSSLAVRVRSS